MINLKEKIYLIAILIGIFEKSLAQTSKNIKIRQLAL